MELPARRHSLERPALPAHFRRPRAFAGRRLAVHGLARSFHLINAQDSALAAPQRIKIVEAGSGDTAETLAARMAFLPRPVDQFMILNGSSEAQRSFPGSATRSSLSERRSLSAEKRARLSGRLVVATHNSGKLRESASS